MKILIKIVLFIFITFLLTPTLVGMADDEIDISCFYNLAEEEETNPTVQEVKVIPFLSYHFYHLYYVSALTFNVNLHHLLQYDNLAHKIFSPPPNLL